MSEELQKCNTDCVYFLASPLSCKKGLECEYRHSEMARLNPRDCWYWLSGNCLNLSCAFRHPPLDGGCTETTSETVPNVSALPVNKTNVPCYYFYNGLCNKGELCMFLHGPIPINNVHSHKSLNARANPDGLPVETKGSAGSDTGSAPGLMYSKSFQTGHQQTVRRPIVSKNTNLEVLRPSRSNCAPNTPRSSYKDAVAGNSISPVTVTDSVPWSPHVSSPGFDVLVDNGSEELVYGDDYNYVVDHDDDSGEPVGDEYDFKEIARDGSEYTSSSLLYEKERHDYDYHFGAPHSLDVREGPPSSRRRVLDRVFPARRRHSPREQASNGHHSIDLRDRLKRRRMNDHSHNAYSEKLESSIPIHRSRERPWYQVEHHRRRSMELENLGPHTGHEGQFRHSSFDRSRLQNKPRVSSKVSGKEVVRKRSSDVESTIFEGPKSLAQIKDERKRTKGSRERSESSLDGHVEDTFDAPKTLGEILEEKRRLL